MTQVVWLGTGRAYKGVPVEEQRVYVREFGIGVSHTLSTGNMQFIKVEASIKFGVPVTASEDALKAYLYEAQVRLEKLARETYANQLKGHQRLTEHQQKVQYQNQLKRMHVPNVDPNAPNVDTTEGT